MAETDPQFAPAPLHVATLVPVASTKRFIGLVDMLILRDETSKLCLGLIYGCGSSIAIDANPGIIYDMKVADGAELSSQVR